MSVATMLNINDIWGGCAVGLVFFFQFVLTLFFIYLWIYLFLAALGLCCTRAFSSCGEQGLLFVAGRGLLIAMASCCRARALGAWASVVVAHRRVPCIGRRILNHCTTTEVPILTLKSALHLKIPLASKHDISLKKTLKTGLYKNISWCGSCIFLAFLGFVFWKGEVSILKRSVRNT